MNTQRYFKAVGLGVMGLLVLTAAVRGEMRLGKPLAAGQDRTPAVAQSTPAVVQFQGILPEGIDGIQDLSVNVYADREQTQLLGEKTFPSVAVEQGIYSLSLPVQEFGLEVGKDYWVSVTVAEEGLTSEVQVSILPKERALAGSDENVTTGRYDLSGSYPEPDFVVRVTNTANGKGVWARSNGGTAVLAETTGTGTAVHAKNLTGKALIAQGDVDVQGNLSVSGEADFTAVSLPAGSVGTTEIADGSVGSADLEEGAVNSSALADGTIVDVDISPTAAIAAGKIAAGAGSGLDADLLDGKSSSEFISSTGDATLNGNLTVQGTGTFNGTGNNYFAGNLGIGTTSPNKSLHVYRNDNSDALVRLQNAGPSGYANITVQSDVEQWHFGVGGSTSPANYNNKFYITRSGNPIPSLIIRSDGNVGIGTTSPAGLLHIVGPSATYSTIFGNTDDGSGDTYIRGSKATSRIWIGDNNTGNVSIVTSGNVGIGTVNPSYKLDVNGDIRSTGTIYGTFSGTVANAIQWDGHSWGETYPYSSNSDTVDGKHNGELTADIWDGHNWGDTYPYSSNSDLVDGIHGSQFLRNDQAGTLNGNLSVNGTIKTKEIIVSTAGWSDFVFERGYSLIPLNELEKHIKAVKHLPGIPPEKEVLENGISVGDMQAKLLKKIEELTLYVIDLQKQIVDLRQEGRQR